MTRVQMERELDRYREQAARLDDPRALDRVWQQIEALEERLFAFDTREPFVRTNAAA